MSNYAWEYIQNHPKETKRLLGINHQQLEQLIELGKLLHREKKEKIEKDKIRINREGGGNNPKLSEEEQIVLMLVYLRHNLSFQLLGLLFKVSESTAHNLFYYWQDLFQQELPSTLLEQVKKFPEEAANLQKELTNYELIVDSSEQVIERPSDHETQKKYYSGKQKKHTFKNQFVVLPKMADIVDVIVGEAGTVSDIKIFRQSLCKWDFQQLFSGDKAYIGELQVTTPHKKPKDRELTEKQKEENKVISSTRIFVEHLIRVVKIFKIIQERFRLHKSRYSAVFLTVCGLVRIRIGSLILDIIKSADSGETIDVIKSHTFPAKLDSVA